MPSKALEFEFKGKDGGFNNLVKESGLSVDQLRAKIKELNATKDDKSGGGSSVVKDLRSQLGARSDFAQLTKIAVGGGAIAGLTLAAGALGNAANKAKELKLQFDQGQISGGAMIEEIAKGVPVFGQFFTAGRQIKDLLGSFDGLAHSGFGKLIGLDEINDAQKIMQAESARKPVLDYISTQLERQKASLKEIAELSKQTTQRTAKAGLEGFALDDANEGDAESARRDKLKDQREKEIEESKKSLTAAQDAISKSEASPNDKLNARLALFKANREEQSQINKKWDDADKQEGEAYQAEHQAFILKKGEEFDKIVASYQKEATDTSVRAQADRLKALGRDLDAELLLIDQSNADKKAEIEKNLKEQLKLAPNQFSKDNLTLAAKQASDAEDQAATAQKHDLVHKALLDGQTKALEAQAAAGDKLAGVELARIAAAKAYNDESNKLLRILKDQTLTVDERKTAEAELKALQAAQSAEIDEQLKNQNNSILQQQSIYGATLKDRQDAEKALESQKIKDALEQRQAEAAAILNNAASTAAQKAQAIANLKTFTDNVAKQFDKDTQQKAEPQKSTATLEESGLLLTGLAAAAKDKASDPQKDVAKNTADAVKLQKDANTQFATFLQQYQQNAQNSLNVTIGVSDG